MSKKMVVRDQYNCKVELPFPPPITVDEIIEKHSKNGIENVNKTTNAFLIYRMVYNHEARELGLPLEDISKLSGNSWKNEPEHIKRWYKEIASAVKYSMKKDKITENADNQASPIMPPVNEQEF
ncbi:18872_t:CDS:2, partial [Acaulospora morrowiae]